MEPTYTSPTNSQPTAPMSSGASHKKVGPMIAILIIVLVVIIGALYMFASRSRELTIPDDGASMTDTQSEAQEVQSVTSNSTDTASLQSDLDASTSGLDSQNF